jgi:SAM-dependent methyltransferase
MDRHLVERVQRRAAGGSAVLVLGSGVGTECFALAQAGYRVTGIDFSPAMVRFARDEAQRRGLAVEWLLADVRTLDLPEAAFAALFFTYDVYSFLPGREQRVALLRKLATWVADDGAIFLSARRVRSVYEALVLTLEWLALRRAGAAEWGDSHTRYIPGDGTLRRSYVHVFPGGALRAEAAAAALRIEAWEGGHGVLSKTRAG